MDGRLADNRTVFGEGRFAQDPQGGKAVEELVVREHSAADEIHIFRLARYDLEKEFEIMGDRYDGGRRDVCDPRLAGFSLCVGPRLAGFSLIDAAPTQLTPGSEKKPECRSRAVTGQLPLAGKWPETATSRGTHTVEHLEVVYRPVYESVGTKCRPALTPVPWFPRSPVQLEVWRGEEGSNVLEVAVSPEDRSRPAILAHKDQRGVFTYLIHRFDQQPPQQEVEGSVCGDCAVSWRHGRN